MSEAVHNLHGDIGLHPCNEDVPDDAECARVHVLQSSNVTGNRHIVRSFKGKLAIYHWTRDGREFVACSENYQIVHEGPDAEHGTQKVQAGVREVRHEMEHDPWRNELRVVVD